MKCETFSTLEVTLFKHSEKTFVAALDAAGISHERPKFFSMRPQASGIVECISALSDAMPWSALSKVVVNWLEARKSREVIIHTTDGRIVHAKGYSMSEVKQLLQTSQSVMIIDTRPDGEL